MDKLSIQKDLFCQEYIVDFNGTQAGIRAGYSESTARQQASALLTSLNIRKRISELISEKLNTDKDEIKYRNLQELAIIAYADITKDINVITKKEIVDGKEIIYQSVEINDTKKSEQSRAIAGIKRTDKGIEVKYHDKIRAIELLGKYGAMWTEKIEVTEHHITVSRKSIEDAE